jgi:hypothetical protein
LVGYVFVIGAEKRGFDPMSTDSGLKSVHSIGTAGDPMPGSPGIPAGRIGIADDPNEQSNINEFPLVVFTAFDVERAGPEPPGSSGFFHMYAEVGPDVGESSKMYAFSVPRIEVTKGRALVVTVPAKVMNPEFGDPPCV